VGHRAEDRRGGDAEGGRQLMRERYNPELLEALKAVLEHASLDPNHLHKFGADYQRAKAAIAEAEGQILTLLENLRKPVGKLGRNK
jgi:hypothetical protein